MAWAQLRRPVVRGCSGAAFVATLLLAPAIASAATVSYGFTASDQTFVVPAGVTSVQVTAIGGGGGTIQGTVGGRGAAVSGALSVTPGQVLYVIVGGAGTTEAGGFNGGAVPRGGGASDVRTIPSSLGVFSLQGRLLAAAGGGGAGGVPLSMNTQSGGDAGADGQGQTALRGRAGGAAAGGAGGEGGAGGTIGAGGAGEPDSGVPAGGGGGGGLYGGGGGGHDPMNGQYGGGGGGSSLVPAGGSFALVPLTTPASVQITYTPPPPPPPKDTVKPKLSALAMSPQRFKAARRGPPIAARGGAKVLYRLSERATVRFTVERVLAGRRRGARCVAATTGRRCTRYVKVRGAFTRAGTAGLNDLRFSGRIGGRKLSPARYRLVATASDAARNRSIARRATFTVVE